MRLAALPVPAVPVERAAPAVLAEVVVQVEQEVLAVQEVQAVLAA